MVCDVKGRLSKKVLEDIIGSGWAVKMFVIGMYLSDETT